MGFNFSCPKIWFTFKSIHMINTPYRCFIPNGYAALASVAGPAILSLVAVVIIFMQAFQVKPQWKRYDDIYMGRYNTTGEDEDWYWIHW